MDEIELIGFRPEGDEDNPKHWGFDRCRSTLSAASSGKSVDLRPFTSPRHNQFGTGTCVAQSNIKALEIKRIMKYGLNSHVDLSRLSLYYLARELMNPPETNKDKGTFNSLAADALRRWGVCPESEWPFDETKLYVPPTWMAMRTAYLHKISAWYKIYSRGQDRVDDVIIALRSGNPVVYGTIVDNQWFNYDGSTPINTLNGVVKGGHATVLVGWDDDKSLFIGENSWGTGWGIDGFYEIRPEVIASSDSSDFVVQCGSWEDSWEEQKKQEDFGG